MHYLATIWNDPPDGSPEQIDRREFKTEAAAVTWARSQCHAVSYRTWLVESVTPVGKTQAGDPDYYYEYAASGGAA